MAPILIVFSLWDIEGTTFFIDGISTIGFK